MATSFSTNLALALPATGELSGTWGTTVNDNITNMLDQALGYQAFTATGGSDTLTIPDGTTGVARSIYIQLNGTGGGTVNVPTAKTKMYFVFNNTSSSITFKVTSQTGVSIPAAAKIALVSNGTDIITAENYLAALTLGAALPVLSGGTGTTTPALVQGSNITITGTWPNQTIAAAGAAQVYPGAGIAVSTGTAWTTSKATPTGVIVGDTDTQTLTNKTLTAPTLTTPVLGTPASGDLTSCTADGTNKVGYQNIPLSGIKTASYTLVAGDVGKFVELGTSGTIVVPASVFTTGDAISIFNNTSASISCTCSAVTTVYKGGTDADIASFSVTTRGVATILFITATVAVVTGNLV